MTRVSGKRIIRSPFCGAVFSTSSYSSLDTFADEYWSEGQRVNCFSPTDGWLRHSSCGRYFLLSQAQNVRMMAERTAVPINDGGVDNYEIPAFLRSGIDRHSSNLPVIGPRPPQCDAEGNVIPTEATRVSDSSLAGIIDPQSPNVQVKIVVCRRYWRLLNAPYRDEYRAFAKRVDGTRKTWGQSLLSSVNRKKSDLVPLPPSFIPTALQRENMFGLLQLIKSQPNPDWLEAAELHRELGEPYSALACLDRTEADPNGFQRALIAEGLQMPVQFQ